MQSACAILSSVACPPPPHVFPTLSHKWHDFGKRLLKIKCVFFIFSTAFVWNTYSKKIWARYDHKFTWVLMLSTHYSCPILRKLEFFLHFFEKSSNITKILLVGAEFFHADRRKDRLDEANIGFSQFCESDQTTDVSVLCKAWVFTAQ
jgi:hypothetical protein